MRPGAWLIAWLPLLSACGDPAPAPKPAAAEKAEPHALQEPLDRARAVEEDMRKARAAQDAALLEEGG